jgi:hypothetical protein
MIKRVGQPPKQCPPGRWGPTRPDEPMTDVPSLAHRVPHGGRISLRSQTCRKADAWGIPESQFVAHCGVPKIEMCTALPLSGDSLRAAWRMGLPSPSARRERAQFAAGGLQLGGDRRAISRLLPSGWPNLTFVLGHDGTAVVAIALSNYEARLHRNKLLKLVVTTTLSSAAGGLHQA